MTEKDNTPRWYVVHTYSGYENKVKANLEKSVENNGLQHLIHEIRIPVEEVVEIKNNKRRIVPHKIFPGYVMIRMVMTDEAWYIVRNTRGVTGFVGPGSRPIPLTDQEIESAGVNRAPVRIDIAVGDEVRILAGTLENFVGKVTDVDTVRQKVRVSVVMFGRDTPAEVALDEVVRV